MIRTIWGDPERYMKIYFPDELRAAGSTSPATARVRDAETGYFTIMGRIDDVLNVSGHRLGTMEIESALVANSELVAEAAVVGRPDDLTGEAICAFVVLKRAAARTATRPKKVAQELRDWVGKEIGPIAQAEGHPLRRQPAEDALGKDHAPAAALARQGRGDHAGRLDARESGDPRAAQAVDLSLRSGSRRCGRHHGLGVEVAA